VRQKQRAGEVPPPGVSPQPGTGARPARRGDGLNGALASNVLNQATLVYDGGTFSGRLTNLGTVVVNAGFTAGNGMENDATFALATGQTVTLNGAGLDNEGTFTMSGGTLNLSTEASAANLNRGSFDRSANLGLGAATFNGIGGIINGTGTIHGASTPPLLRKRADRAGVVNGPAEVTSSSSAASCF
jgi:hypothetical protein